MNLRISSNHNLPLNTVNMLTSLLFIALPGLAMSLPTSSVTERSDSCSEVQIPITVSVPRYPISVTIEDDWDAAQLTFNITSQDFTDANDPLPIGDSESAPVESTYTIGATLRGTGETMLVLTHGIIESKL